MVSSFAVHVGLSVAWGTRSARRVRSHPEPWPAAVSQHVNTLGFALLDLSILEETVVEVLELVIISVL